MSDGMGREPVYLSSHATNRYFIPNWGNNADCVERDNRSSNKRKPVKKEEAREHYPLIPPGLTPNSSLKHLLK